MKLKRIFVGGLGALIVAGLFSWVAGAKHPSTLWLERAYYLSQVLILVVTTVAAILVYGQISQIRESLKRDDFDSTSARIARISDLLLENYSDYAALRSGHTSERAMLLAESLLDVMDTEMLRRRALPDLQGPDVPSLEDYFRDLLDELPGLAEVLARRATWYSKELLSMSRPREVSPNVGD